MSVERLMSDSDTCFICAQKLGVNDIRLIAPQTIIRICEECAEDYFLMHGEMIEQAYARGANPLELIKPRSKALHEDGLSLRNITDETGISKSTVQRLTKKIEADAAAAEMAAAAKDTP